MYIPLGIKSDYSLLQSLIKIPELITYLKEHNITACGLLDDNLFGSMNFYNNCINNGIKPMDVIKEYFINHKKIIFAGDGYSPLWGMGE